MTTMTPVEPPVEGALAWKIEWDEGSRQARYPLTDEGPWLAEPDKVQWVDPETGLDCLIVRNHFGSLCGYVGVPSDHPAYEVDHYDELSVQVHGGLTFANKCSPVEPGEDEDQPTPGICHVPFPGRPHDVFWLGFDCGHAFDLQPGLAQWEKANFPPDMLEVRAAAGMSPFIETYRDIAYVVSECTDLAQQLKALA